MLEGRDHLTGDNLDKKSDNTRRDLEKHGNALRRSVKNLKMDPGAKENLKQQIETANELLEKIHKLLLRETSK